MTAGETWERCLQEIRDLPSVKKYGQDVRVSMYRYDRPSWTGEVFETECYFPTWINREDAAHVRALVEAHQALYGPRRVGAPSALPLRQRPLVDKWTFFTNCVAIQGRYGIPCVGLWPRAESQAHAPNERTWKQDLVTWRGRCTRPPSPSTAPTPAKPFPTAPATDCPKGENSMDSVLQGFLNRLETLDADACTGGDFFLYLGENPRRIGRRVCRGRRAAPPARAQPLGAPV